MIRKTGTIKVYVKLNEQNEITEINSDIFLADTTGYVMIDEGNGDKFAHAQGNYLEKGLCDEQGRYNYKLVDGKVVEIVDKPTIEVAPQITTEDRLEALESAMLEMLMGGAL